MRDLSALPNLNVALIQTTLAWHDRQANLQHFEPLLEPVSYTHLTLPTKA